MESRFCFRLLAALTFGFALLAPARSWAAGDQAAGHGRQLFMANNCYLCHGTVGQGGAGPRVAPLPPKSGSDFAAFVRHPGGRMPAYTTAVLDDADLAAIYAYLQSIPPPNGLPALLSGSSRAGAN